MSLKRSESSDFSPPLPPHVETPDAAQDFLDQPGFGLEKTDHPFDLISSLGNKEVFKEELSKLFTPNEKIKIDLSEDFEDLKEHAETPGAHPAIEKFIKNRAEFIREVFSDLKEDLPDLCAHFRMNREEIAEIHVKSLGADTHNGGKSTVFIDFVLKSGETKSLVYKPRLMFLEFAICDEQTGVFHQLSKVKGVEETADITAFTYPVITKEKEGRDYGYSLKVPGRVLYDENATLLEDNSLSTAHFMKNESGLESRNFNALVALIKDKQSKSEKDEDVSSFIDELQSEFQTDFPATTLDQLLTNVLEESFFSTRSDEQLKSDYLLFFIFSLLELGDLHGGNFIQSEVNGALVPIDLECTQKNDAMEILQQISAEIERREIPIPGDLLNDITNFIQNLNLNFSEKPLRLIPMPTEELYIMRNNFLSGNVIPVKGQFFKALNYHCEIKNKESLGRLLTQCFQKLDIPFLTARFDQLVFEGETIGRKRSDQEKEQIVLKEIAEAQGPVSSAGSVIIHS